MALLLETGSLFILVHWISGRCLPGQASTITPSSPDFRKIFILNWDTWMVGQHWKLLGAVTSWFFASYIHFAPHHPSESKAAFRYMRFSFAEISTWLPVLLMLTHLRITWSLLKGYLFSPLWDPGSVFTHFISRMTYFFRSSKVLFKYIHRSIQLDTMEEMRTTNWQMLQIWQRKQKHWERF